MSNTKTRKLTIVRTPTSLLRPVQGEAVHVGVDEGDLQRRRLQRRPRAPDDLGPARPAGGPPRAAAPGPGGVAQVVSEAGPTGFGLARRLWAEGYAAQVIAPSKRLAPVGPEAKSDRLDCRRLAQLSAKGLLHPVRVPTAQEEADRQVLRLREQLVRKTRSVQSQIKAFLLQHGIVEPAGLGHWSKASVAVLRGLELLPELQFCLDLLLDEQGHAQEQVQRVTRPSIERPERCVGW